MATTLKILYAVQATGNGHIARAEILVPYLQQYGTVDVFLSGSNSSLQTHLPIQYRSKGLSLFYGNRGGLHYRKIWKELNFKRIYQEAKALPVHDYDVVLNDFDCITSLACKLQKKESILFGHQASFISKKSPRPFFKDPIGEWVLQQYATATKAIGLHFMPYDSFVYNPIIKDEIIQAKPSNKGHVTVYLGHYNDDVVIQALHQIPNTHFHLFSKKATSHYWNNNVLIQPVSNTAFTNSVIHCYGVITGAGFETPAEALYLQKQVLCLPIKGQYEQWCNAAALAKNFNVPIIKSINKNFVKKVQQWLQQPTCIPLTLQHSTSDIVQQVMQVAENLRKQTPTIASITPAAYELAV